jgi:lysophospholipase L1-like esterase
VRGTWPVVGALSVVLAASALVEPGGPRVPDGARRDGGGQPDLSHWVGTWAASPQRTEEANLPPAPGFADATLRQIAHVSIGGKRLRVRFSNAFGKTALTLRSAHAGRAAGGSAIRTQTDEALTFHGRPSVTIPEGALIVSDPLDFDLPPSSDLAVSVHLTGAPADVTGHPGSRTTSYLQAGDEVSAAELPTAARVDHWYFLDGIDVWADRSVAAVAVLGDSITDGRGSTTNGNDRWPDDLARRLQSAKGMAPVAVVNHGIGGNRLLRDGLGPNTLARLDRDVLAQPGVRWLIVLEGINDIGTRVAAKAENESAATAEDIIAAYDQIVARAHARGIRVYGATILPFEGAAAYFTPDGEADRQAVNAWIRTSGRFDAVIDFDLATRDPDRPSRLSPSVDGGDHLHPSAAGYRIMADAVDLDLFAGPPARR